MAVLDKEFTYAPPGLPGSPVPLKERYDNFIGGRWVAPTKGNYSVDLTPATGRPITEVPRSTAEDVELALDAAHAAKVAWGETSIDRALARSQRDRRRHRREPRDAGRRRELGERQAGPRDARRRHPACRRSLPLLRERDPRRGRVDLRDRQGHHRVPVPRATRCRRPDRPVQLPAPHGVVEDRAGPRGRQRHDREAGQPDAVVDPQADGAHRAHRAGRRHQRRQRPGRRGRDGPRVEQADREGRVHRRDRDRADDHAVRRPEPHSVDDRARRQVPEHLLRGRHGRRRRLPRQGDRGTRPVRVQQG